RAASASWSSQSVWLQAIASPQYASAKEGSTRCASRKSSRASSYWKLCSAVTPRRNGACAAAEPEFGKRMGARRSSARSAKAPTAAMLACGLVAAGDTRRRFLEAAGTAAVATWLAPIARAAAAAGIAGPAVGDGEILGTLPFVGEGEFPLEATVGHGL